MNEKEAVAPAAFTACSLTWL